MRDLTQDARDLLVHASTLARRRAGSEVTTGDVLSCHAALRAGGSEARELQLPQPEDSQGEAIHFSNQLTAMMTQTCQGPLTYDELVEEAQRLG